MEILAPSGKETEPTDGEEKKEERIGRFLIHTEFIRQHWEKIVDLVPRHITVDINYVYNQSCLEITAYCSQFDPCPEGTQPPLYKVVPKVNKYDKIIEINFMLDQEGEHSSLQDIILVPKGSAMIDNINTTRNRGTTDGKT